MSELASRAIENERDAALAVIEHVRARLERPMHPYGDKKLAMVPEKVFLADAYGEDFVQDLDAILAQSPASALAKVKADAWDEGHTAGVGWALDPLNGGSSRTNPYRKEGE